jgi:hypothetical protein
MSKRIGWFVLIVVAWVGATVAVFEAVIWYLLLDSLVQLQIEFSIFIAAAAVLAVYVAWSMAGDLAQRKRGSK